MSSCNAGTKLRVKPTLGLGEPITTLLHRTLEANCSKRHHVLAVLLVGSDPFDAVAPKSVDASKAEPWSGIH